MARWQAVVLILENAAQLLVLLWCGAKFGKWIASRDRNTESALALVTELQKHRAHHSVDAASHVATFVHTDREESA